MTARKASLRKSTWTGDKVAPRDVAELSRDVDARTRALENGSNVQVVSLPNYTYAPPIMIDTGGRMPAAVHVGAMRIPGSPVNIQPSITPLWDMLGGQVRINSITIGASAPTVGTKYDVSILLFYAGT